VRRFQEGRAVSDDFASQVAGVGALDEPARRALYLFVTAQPDAVSREQAASGCNLPLHAAKFHLDRLVQEGLLDVEFRRLTGRSGPGAGRPSKLYRRSNRELSVTLPERRYDLAGDILAEAIDTAVRESISVQQAVGEVARSRGRQIGGDADDLHGGPELDRTTEVLARHGYEPRLTTDRDVCLANCPFDRLARKHTELVCSMNVAFVAGVLEGLGCDSLEAVLDPQPGLCCVKARAR
jgi:predicted ArsR family transcriptional regulator